MRYHEDIFGITLRTAKVTNRELLTEGVTLSPKEVSPTHSRHTFDSFFFKLKKQIF